MRMRRVTDWLAGRERRQQLAERLFGLEQCLGVERDEGIVAYRRARESNTLSPELQAFVDQRLKQLQ